MKERNNWNERNKNEEKNIDDSNQVMTSHRDNTT